MPGAPGGAMTDAPGGRGREGCRSLSTRASGTALGASTPIRVSRSRGPWGQRQSRYGQVKCEKLRPRAVQRSGQGHTARKRVQSQISRQLDSAFFVRRLPGRSVVQS